MIEKISEEELYEEAANSIGQAYLLKTAGEISDEEFEEYADDVLDKTASLGSSLARFGRKLRGKQTFGDKMHYLGKRVSKAADPYIRKLTGRKTTGERLGETMRGLNSRAHELGVAAAGKVRAGAESVTDAVKGRIAAWKAARRPKTLLERVKGTAAEARARAGKAYDSAAAFANKHLDTPGKKAAAIAAGGAVGGAALYGGYRAMADNDAEKYYDL